jgi:predicted metal-dependent phosphoesterase TrpH
MLFDLHIHSRFSPCSELSTLEAIERAHALGLDGICFTDHHSRGSARLIQEGPQENGLVVLVGQEYATGQGDFLLFGPLPELAPSMSAQQLLQMVEHTGGVAIGAHPFRRGRGVDPELAGSGLLHFIEGINGRNLSAENERANLWGRDHGMGLVGGSDAHTTSELGMVVTEFREPILNQDDLVWALKGGDFQARWTSDYYLRLFTDSRYATASMAK